MPTEGPIVTPMEWIPGDPKDLRGDNNGVFNGEPGYPAGTPDKIPTLIYDREGPFGQEPKDNAKGV